MNIRVIISGGGTGGHIFPALSIANAVKAKCPNAEILFVGADNRMEMQRVPAAGYRIIGLPVSGFDRKNLLKNVAVLWRLIKSQCKARRVIREFRPHVAVGVGGYASGPTLKMAGSMGIPTLIQEQNSYAGVTNKLLAQKAHRICVAYEGMERFFPKDKILLTGNPVRQNLLTNVVAHDEAMRTFGLDPAKRTILVLGGSLGARTLNESMLQAWDALKDSNVQVIWQTGKDY
jgi:UDP-N-acetylglucosamine--N-acetylmuramyl-(pentapeptide) pyrophosphoryl-undecaprenol N-acetylglucosamine transferase